MRLSNRPMRAQLVEMETQEKDNKNCPWGITYDRHHITLYGRNCLHEQSKSIFVPGCNGCDDSSTHLTQTPTSALRETSSQVKRYESAAVRDHEYITSSILRGVRVRSLRGWREGLSWRSSRNAGQSHEERDGDKSLRFSSFIWGIYLDSPAARGIPT